MRMSKEKPIQLSLLRKIVNVKLCHILEGNADIITTIKDLKDVGVVNPTISPKHELILTVHKTDGSWIMTVDYHKLNRMVTPTAAAIPDAISLSE